MALASALPLPATGDAPLQCTDLDLFRLHSRSQAEDTVAADDGDDGDGEVAVTSVQTFDLLALSGSASARRPMILCAVEKGQVPTAVGYPVDDGCIRRRLVATSSYHGRVPELGLVHLKMKVTARLL